VPDGGEALPDEARKLLEARDPDADDHLAAPPTNGRPLQVNPDSCGHPRLHVSFLFVVQLGQRM
jgi:hypothetical protein